MASVKELIARSSRLLTPSEPATNRPRNVDYPQAAAAREFTAVLREVLPDRLRWQRVRYATPPQIEAYGEIEDGYPLETMPLEPFARWVYAPEALGPNFFPLIARHRNGAWILTPARKFMGSVQPLGKMSEPYPSTVDLAPRVDFVPWPVKQGDVTYLGLVSRRPTQIRNADPAAPLCTQKPLGYADWVFANWTINIVTGALQVTVLSEGARCVGGFCPVSADGRATGFGATLRGVLRGWIIMLTSGTEADPILAGVLAAGGSKCDNYEPPTADQGCYSSTATDDCPYCHHSAISVDCTIERDGCNVTSGDDECVCDPGFGNAVNGFIVGKKPDGFMPGAKFISNPDEPIPDIYGQVGPFFAQTEDGIGLVLYTLNPEYPIMVDPRWPDPRTVQHGLWCSWLCRATIHNESAAWRVWCNSVIRSDDGQADQNVPKPIDFAFAHDQRLCHVHFAFGRTVETGGEPCFQLNDQVCFTGHPDHDTWGHKECPTPLCDPYLVALDQVGVHLPEMTIAPTAESFRHRHPSVVRFMNDVLKTVGRAAGVNAQTPVLNLIHSHFGKYDAVSLNQWAASIAWGCPPTITEEEDIRRVVLRTDPERGIQTTPWVVRVRMLNSSCVWTANVLLSRVDATLRLSSESNIYLDRGVSPIANRRHTVYYAQFRLVAKVELHFHSAPVPCEGIRKIGERCEPLFTVDRPLVYTLDEGADYVPLTVEWRGLLGPRPWSSKFDQRKVGSCIGWSNAGAEDVLPEGGALDQGLVIPGEVNDTRDGDPPQVFGGRVVVFT